jgi:alpha-glucosidase
MKTRLLSLLLVAAGITYSGCSTAPYSLCGEKIAVFYPRDFDREGNLPSFALLEEPARTGNLPRDWKITPRFSVEEGKNVVSIPLEEGVDLYGTGEVVGPLRRNGTRFTTWNLDNYVYALEEGRNLYQSHPWILGVRPDGSAFGILVDNTWRQEYLLSDTIRITVDGPAPRVLVIERDDPAAVVRALGELTGTIEMPPLWALGFQQSRWSYFPDARVREVADEFRKRRIPCDVIWMDIDYMDGFRVFTFDPARFPDPAALNAYLHDRHFKAVYMIDPGIKKDTAYAVYREGTAGDHWVQDRDGREFNGPVWPGPCAFPDFTRPETRDWWKTLYAPFLATGIDGVWNDMNEPAVFRVESHTMPLDNLHRGGGDLPPGTHARYHNVYGLLMVKATRDAIVENNPGKRPFVLSRANFLGGQRYAATWSGDNASTWKHLRLSIPMTLNLGLSGQPFNGADIGGFAGNARPALFAHWIALGAYYPFARDHSVQNSADQEPWSFGEEIESVARTAINRRYQLLPYLYTLFREAATTGMPVARPLFMADPRDTSLRREEQVFLLGQDLAVVPRWAVVPKLPAGDWKALTLEEKSDDGYQPLLYLRPGAIVPVGKVIQHTGEYATDSITLLVNPGDPAATGTLYDDDGDGFGYKQGNFALHRFTATPDEENLAVEIRRVEGTRQVNRQYRVGFLLDGRVAYSAWSADTTRVVPVISRTTADACRTNE